MTSSQNGHHVPDDTPYRRQCARDDCQEWFPSTDKPDKRYCSKDCREQALQARRRERHIARQQGVSIEDNTPDAAQELPALVARAIREDWPITPEIRQTLPQTMFAIANDDGAKPQDRISAARSIVAMKDQNLKLLQIAAQAEQQQPADRPQSIVNIGAMQAVFAAGPDAILALQMLSERAVNGET